MTEKRPKQTEHDLDTALHVIERQRKEIDKLKGKQASAHVDIAMLKNESEAK